LVVVVVIVAYNVVLNGLVIDHKKVAQIAVVDLTEADKIMRIPVVKKMNTRRVENLVQKQMDLGKNI
jgi:hypothetical protein